MPNATPAGQNTRVEAAGQNTRVEVSDAIEIGVNWAGIVVTLSHEEEVDLYNATDVSGQIQTLVGQAKAAITGLAADIAKPIANLALVIQLLTLWVRAERDIMKAVDQGSGVYLTLPWFAIINPFGWVLWWLIIPTPGPPPVVTGLQNDWLWCSKCSGLFWSWQAEPAQGTCPAGGQHQTAGGSNYSLGMAIPSYPGQHDWRWCSNCAGLFWASGGNRTTGGICPTSHGTHDGSKSSDYGLTMDSRNLTGEQDQWRCCSKCSGLFWGGGARNAGTCPASGTHNGTGSSDYSLMIQTA
jgi:hypothetical protein